MDIRKTDPTARTSSSSSSTYVWSNNPFLFLFQCWLKRVGRWRTRRCRIPSYFWFSHFRHDLPSSGWESGAKNRLEPAKTTQQLKWNKKWRPAGANFLIRWAQPHARPTAFFLNYHPMFDKAGFDLTAHNSACVDDATRPRRQGRPITL
jgi:hypothetical protein